MKLFLPLLLLLLSLVSAHSQSQSLSFITLNCYWFFGEENYREADRPKDQQEYELKAGHLIGLLPKDAPLFVGLQEIGNGKDVQALAQSASKRYRRSYQTLFVQGKDTSTKQDVGALLDTTRGWGVYGKASRPVELDQDLSKHLVVRLTNASTALDVCVVHLRRPIGSDGEKKQQEQISALLKWSMRHLAKEPKANLIIMGDFNEGQPVGSEKQRLKILEQARPPLVDALSSLSGRVKTHADGKAYDRIFVSTGIWKGETRLKFEQAEVIEHLHGKGEGRRLYTDHFPVVVRVREN